MKKLILYHGTDCLFDKIDLKKSIAKRDFGVGFYTTTIAAQAESWAKNKMLRNASENAFVYVYELTLSEELSIQEFEGLSTEWLEMIKANRTLGGIQHDFDIMIGPVANDNTMVTVSRYIGGIYTAQEAIERLNYSAANNQVSFHTQKALEYLTQIRRYRVG